jgi:hypothetical protein
MGVSQPYCEDKPGRLKYGDKKLLKGKAVFNKLARRDVLMGLVPPMTMDPDLRNTYLIIGICGICTRLSPVRYRITDDIVDANLFLMVIDSAIVNKFLQVGGVLILDNTTNHTGKGNSILEEWLWEDHMVLVKFLPARAPEWNPIKLMWNCLPQCLMYFDVSSLTGTHRVVLVFNSHGHKR